MVGNNTARKKIQTKKGTIDRQSTKLEKIMAKLYTHQGINV